MGSLRTRLVTLVTETPNLVPRFAHAAVCGAGTRLFAHLGSKVEYPRVVSIMLAERMDREKWSQDPRNTFWSKGEWNE